MIAKALPWPARKQSRPILSSITTLDSELNLFRSNVIILGTNFVPLFLIGDFSNWSRNNCLQSGYKRVSYLSFPFGKVPSLTKCSLILVRFL